MTVVAQEANSGGKGKKGERGVVGTFTFASLLREKRVTSVEKTSVCMYVVRVECELIVQGYYWKNHAADVSS